MEVSLYDKKFYAGINKWLQIEVVLYGRISKY